MARTRTHQRRAAHRRRGRTAVAAIVAATAVCLALTSPVSAATRASATELQFLPAVGSLAASWSTTGAGKLEGFRVSWRPQGAPDGAWSKPVELGAQARFYQITGLPASAAVYEVHVQALIAVTHRSRSRHKAITTRTLGGLAEGAATTVAPEEVLQSPPEPPFDSALAAVTPPPSEPPSTKEPAKEGPPPAKEPPREGEPPHEEPPHEEPPHEEPPHEEPPHEEPPGPGCALYGAPSGNDASAGTQAVPLKTVGALLGRLRAGQTGCLAPGRYAGFTVRGGESRGSAGAPVTITSTNAQAPATIAGRVVTEPGADYLTFTHLDFNDPEVTPPSVTIGSAHTSWTYDDVTASSTICFQPTGQGQFGPGEDTLIEHDRVHNCGQPFACESDSTPCNEPPTNGYFIHGVYDLGVRTTVRNSYIYDNSSKGILLRGGSGAVIEHNVIDGNGSGITFGDLTPANDTVRWNIITNSRGICGGCQDYNGVWTFGSVGPGNSVTNNDVFGNASGNLVGLTGLNVAENLEVDPLFVNPGAHEYALQPASPVLGYGPQ